MSGLSVTFIVKIVATLVFWCVPLLFFPNDVLAMLGFPEQPTYVFVRLLGWAYLALCVGYAFGLRASLRGERLAGPIWVGIVSNGGASALLLFFGRSGSWTDWGALAQALMWASTVATALITFGLVWFGVLRDDPS